MPTTLRLLLLLMLGLFGLQPVGYGYDAPGGFVSGAQNIVTASPEIGAATVESAAPVSLNFNREGGVLGKQAETREIPNFVAAESEMTTVLGSKADVAPFVGKPGFNTFTGEGIPAAELDRANAQWLNQAIQRGDNILLKTDPAAHAQFLQTLPGNPQSAYLNLELPMLQQYEGVNVTQGFGGAAAAGK